MARTVTVAWALYMMGTKAGIPNSLLPFDYGWRAFVTHECSVNRKYSCGQSRRVSDETVPVCATWLPISRFNFQALQMFSCSSPMLRYCDAGVPFWQESLLSQLFLHGVS
ncbi:hypothetical protein K466DRAFT_585150 [Polyporus arcularius HHB13444]|uniref:Uncharacterized protein n=1 Tax=Polyporus arcularius HHB13444 TaxID=1314778 RepID=A0A5C3PKQ0_9APHY|nr:hypothetical protein K466DRAFT_585150 [Polyporus arcularius HHB13444]